MSALSKSGPQLAGRLSPPNETHTSSGWRRRAVVDDVRALWQKRSRMGTRTVLARIECHGDAACLTDGVYRARFGDRREHPLVAAQKQKSKADAGEDAPRFRREIGRTAHRRVGCRSNSDASLCACAYRYAAMSARLHDVSSVGTTQP